MDASWANINQGLSFLLLALPPVFLGALLVARLRMGSGYSLQNAVIRSGLDAALALSLAGIVVVTMVPSPTVIGGPFFNFVPGAGIIELADGSVDRTIPLVNLVSNILLFMPLGFFYALRFHRARPILTACIVGVCVSCAIEVFQVLLPGRTVDVDDVIFNGLGTLIGAVVSLPVPRMAGRRSVSDR
ncbi:MAG TPA: VanZ family protein [Actinomycetota bacterium]|nr:VanZ family protein [Actinomycetota bacterium]